MPEPTISSEVLDDSGRVLVRTSDGTPFYLPLAVLLGKNGYWLQPNADGSINVIQAATASVALSGPPAALTASADTTFTFASQVRHVEVWNKSATPVYVEFDAAASVGSRVVPAASGGQPGYLWEDVPVTVVHLYSTAATAVNGTADLNIVLKGWS